MVRKILTRLGSQEPRQAAASERNTQVVMYFCVALVYLHALFCESFERSLVAGFCRHSVNQALADLSLGTAASGYWPGTGSLLLLKLLVQIFPSTDFRCVQ